MEASMESPRNDQGTPAAAQPLSKNAQKRLLKQQRYEEKKAEKKAQVKEQKKKEVERKRKEWQEKLAGVSDGEREKLIEERKNLRKERMEQRSEERGKKIGRLQQARIDGQNIVIDLEFAHLMSSSELHSLVQQIMYCYSSNGKCPLPAHIWLTGCLGEMKNQLLRIPGYGNWVIEKEDRSYVEVFQDQKENLVYLTADSENVLDELDPKSIYIIGGLVDRNRWKGITMKKAEEQGIKTAKLPIGAYMKMSSSQVLTVNQVIDVLLKFLETKDWKNSFFQVIPQRKRCESSSEDNQEEGETKETEQGGDEKLPGSEDRPEDNQEARLLVNDQRAKRQCLEQS
ncbi:tRNA (guanine(9)-N1)-methyltransferase-like [Andrographis paniculata]|uniref:tRNA (guanine(9)-N1)-methyltransferase-like n=1 Tax=Andrographis paniculata TaxID=175694 RepID=UPI0021E8090C|nr:tRNA (guanine(9)-N1)-methyltransferase-like [Andrographis paniculata]